jgi:hypothetical protein
MANFVKIAELASGIPLFNAEAKSNWTEEDDHLAQILEVLSTTFKYPEHMRAGKGGAEFFNEEGTVPFFLVGR